MVSTSSGRQTSGPVPTDRNGPLGELASATPTHCTLFEPERAVKYRMKLPSLRAATSGAHTVAAAPFLATHGGSCGIASPSSVHFPFSADERCTGTCSTWL